MLSSFFEVGGSAPMRKELFHAKNIDEYLNNNVTNMIDDKLSNYLNTLVCIKDTTIPQIAEISGLDKGYVYHIFAGRKTPSRDKLIAIAYGLGLSDTETQQLLKISGNRELYVKDKRDAIILYCLHNQKDIRETNDLLYEHGLEILGKVKD